MNKILTSESRADLIALHKKERDRRIRDRMKAVIFYDEGWSFVEISKSLLLDETTVSNYVVEFQDKNKLAPDHKGSEPILSEQETAQASAHIEDNLYQKTKEIQVYIKKTFNKQLAISTLHSWLKKNDFTYKKPKNVPKGPNVELQKEFIDFYETLMTSIAKTNEVMLFGDSVHPTQQTRIAYGWIKKGKEKAIETTNGRKRLNLMGVLNLEELSVKVQDYETIDADAAVNFLEIVEKTYPDADKIHLIWDQAGYHTAEKVKVFLTNSRIKVHYLPQRSPNLNVIERLWKIMHEYVSNNIVHKNFQEFKDRTFDFFSNTVLSIKEVLESRLTDHFQILKPEK